MENKRSELRTRYESLCALPSDATKQQRAARGHAFEQLLHDLLSLDDLSPRLRYRPAGEEIDGSFLYGDRAVLLELKWQEKPQPASAIYQFKGKVDGKLVGTVGVFASMSGFSEDAADALTMGKNLNVILFDASDIDAAFNTACAFRKVLSTKLRRAAEEGVVFYPFAATTIGTTGSPGAPRIITQHDILADALTKSAPDVVIICEGTRDEVTLTRLSEKILDTNRLQRRVIILPAMGKFAVPHLANSIGYALSGGTRLVLVVDSDGDQEKTLQQMQSILTVPADAILTPSPTIEAWFWPTIAGPYRGQFITRTAYEEIATEAIKNLDLVRLGASDASFAKLIRILTS